MVATPVNPPGSLLVIDTTAVTNDTRVALAILQGLANLRMPSGGQAAYFQVPPMANCFPEEVFNLWPEIYSRQLAIGFESGTAEDLVNLALERGVDAVRDMGSDRTRHHQCGHDARVALWHRCFRTRRRRRAAGPRARALPRPSLTSISRPRPTPTGGRSVRCPRGSGHLGPGVGGRSCG